MDALRQEIRTYALEQRAAIAEIKTQAAELRLEIKSEIARLGNDMSVMRLEMHQQFGALMDAIADLRRDFDEHTHEEAD